MYKLFIVGFVILSLCVSVNSETLPIVELKPGSNEISVKIQNKWNMNLESVYVDLKRENLPKGFSISPSSQRLNVSANSRSSEGLILCISVNAQAKEGIYEIPIVLKDKANHSWNFILTARLGISKPEKYELAQNYPNPFNATTQIEYSLMTGQEQKTQLIIYDVLGQQIRMLINKKQPAGIYHVIWDGKDEAGGIVASGIYFYKLVSGSFVKINKMMLLK